MSAALKKASCKIFSLHNCRIQQKQILKTFVFVSWWPKYFICQLGDLCLPLCTKMWFSWIRTEAHWTGMHGPVCLQFQLICPRFNWLVKAMKEQLIFMVLVHSHPMGVALWTLMVTLLC